MIKSRTSSNRPYKVVVRWTIFGGPGSLSHLCHAIGCSCVKRLQFVQSSWPRWPVHGLSMHCEGLLEEEAFPARRGQDGGARWLEGARNA